MEAEDADDALGDHDRGREDREDVSVRVLANVAELRVAQFRRLAHVTDRHRASLADAEVRHGQAARVAQSLDTLRCPLHQGQGGLIQRAQADVAAVDTGCLRRQLDRDLEQLVEVAPRAHLVRDAGDQPLTLERVRQRSRRLSPRQRQARLRRERLDQRELLLEKDARLPHRREHDADHLVPGAHGDERAALDLRDRVEPAVDDRRALGVVDRERRAFANHGADSGRLLVEGELEADQPFVVAAAVAGRDDARPSRLVIDEREVGKVETAQLCHLVEELAGDLVRAVGVEEPVREPADPLELAVAERGAALCFARPLDAAREQTAIRPVARDDDGRDEREQDGGEGDERVPSDRLLVDQDLDPDDGGRHAHARERQRGRKTRVPHPAAFAPQCRHQGDAHGEVERRQNEQRHRVEQHRLSLCVHRATTHDSETDAGLKDGPYGLLERVVDKR